MLRLTRAQVREIDRRSIEQYHIPGIVLMENAARAAADTAMAMLDNIARPMVTIICGGGNNGGDGLALARHLHNRGVNVILGQAWHGELKGDAATNLAIVQSMNISICPFDHIHALRDAPGELLIDALFGTGLTRPIAGELVPVVQWMDGSQVCPVLAIDVPSGLDCDTGEPLGPCVRATRTITFVAEKAGFANPNSQQFTGQVIVGDIGCPRELIDAVSLIDNLG